MADTSRNGGKILNEGKKLTPSLSKNSSGNNDVVPTLLTTPDPLPAEPMNPDFDKGRPATHRIDTQGSVQALVVDGDVVIAGLQDGTLAGWSLQTYEQLFTIQAHDQSILALFISEDRELLFSSGVDSTVKVWSLRTFTSSTSFHSLHEIGDIFCLAYSVKRKTLFTGSQNGAIQYATLEEDDLEEPLSALSLNSRKHRFFDSLGPGGAVTTVPKLTEDSSSARTTLSKDRYFPTLTYRPYAHSSYIYSMLLVKGLFNHDNDKEVLVTGGGDGSIKIWTFGNHASIRIQKLTEHENEGLSVLSMAFGGLFLYAGMSDGLVHVYNLASNQLVHRIEVGAGDVTSVQVLAGMLLVGTSLGQLTQFSTQFTQIENWTANRGKILATGLARYLMKDVFLTAGNDGTIAVWDLSDMVDPATPMTPHGNDDMIQSLRELVSYRTVAANPKYASDCHEAVGFLRKLFNLFNAQSQFLLPTGNGINPILLARFDASELPNKQKTILFYGHYDVVDAEQENGDWSSDPFKLYPSNGFLYGRGVTDNKGPILAAMFAVAELVKTKSLSCNVIFLLEGEEEAGSRHLQETVKTHKGKIGHIDYILLSNSVWLDDHIPCATYGMRGVIHATVTVSSGRIGQHSGMDGKVSQNEPLKDLILIISELSGPQARTVQIPNFYRNIKDRNTQWEEQQYDFIAKTLMQGHPEIKNKSKFVQSLEERWQEPNLTVHGINCPESKTAVTISGSAKATLSIRIVPNQTAKEIAALLTNFLEEVFEKTGSKNKLQVAITSTADPWLADPKDEPFNSLSYAITEVWHPQEDSNGRSFPSQTAPIQLSTQPALLRPTHRRASSLATRGFFKVDDFPRAPLFIREGGSIPAIAFLEKEFHAKASMFPMGQASDNAHLANERMRVENLYKGKAVLKRVFSEL